MTPALPAGNEDPSIPVLTERLPAAEVAGAAKPNLSLASGIAAPAVVADGPAIEGGAQQAALAQLAARLPAEVEALTAQHVEAAIEGATERLAEQLRTAVAAAVRDSVRAALADEIARLRKREAAG